MITQITLKQLKTALEETQHLAPPLFSEAGAPENWKSIRENAKYRTFWQEMVDQAEKWSADPPSSPLFTEFTMFGDTGDREVYQNKWGRLYSVLHTFSLLTICEDKPEWTAGLNNVIWAICNEYTWVLPAHVGLYVNEYPNGIWDQPLPPRETVDLSSANIAFTLAEVLHRLGDRLHPWVVHRAKQEIDRRIFQVVFESPYPQNWELKTNNWPASCASSIGAAAIYLVEDSEKLAGMLWRVIGVLRSYLSGFDEQGATPEGPGYWQYGFSHYVYFSELLKERTHGRISLLTEPKVEPISLFPQMCMLSGGKVVNFSDSFDEVRMHTGLIHRLQQYVPSLTMPAERYRLNTVPLYWVDASRLMLWSPDETFQSVETFSEGADVQERIFTGNQWVISKVTGPEGRLIAFAAKGGYNEEPHNHNDLGHFILHVDGFNVLADIGVGVYTRQYFQPHIRYEMLNAGSHGHSVPIVDGARQGFGRAYRSELLHAEQTDRELRMELDLTKAYECPSLKRLTRKFIWRRSGEESPQLIVADQATFSQTPASFQEVFVSSVQPQETEPGRIQLGCVALHYDAESWKLVVEAFTHETPSKEIKSFYRLIFSHTNPRSSLLSEFRFEVQ